MVRQIERKRFQNKGFFNIPGYYTNKIHGTIDPSARTDTSVNLCIGLKTEIWYSNAKKQNE